MNIYGTINSNGDLSIYGYKSGGFGDGTYRVRVFDPGSALSDQCKGWNTVKATKSVSGSPDTVSFPSFASLLTCGGEKAYCITKTDGGDDAYWCSGRLIATYQ
jgi:hypothetical protein